MPQLNFSIPHGLLAKLDAAKPEYLDRKGFLCLLLDQALDSSCTLGTADGTEAVTSKEVTSTKKEHKTNKSICDSLTQHETLIREFWKVKKGSKGDVAWKLLQTELTKLQDAYGDAVVADQLQLAINAKWAGVSAARYEQFKPQGKTIAPPPRRKKTEAEIQAEEEAAHQQRLREMGLI